MWNSTKENGTDQMKKEETSQCDNGETEIRRKSMSPHRSGRFGQSNNGVLKKTASFQIRGVSGDKTVES